MQYCKVVLVPYEFVVEHIYHQERDNITVNPN